MDIEVERSANRLPHSFSLKPETVELLDALAVALDTNRSRVVEAMVQGYAPALLLKAEKDRKKA